MSAERCGTAAAGVVQSVFRLARTGVEGTLEYLPR